jgi:hypothetical protein
LRPPYQERPMPQNPNWVHLLVSSASIHAYQMERISLYIKKKKSS